MNTPQRTAAAPAKHYSDAVGFPACGARGDLEDRTMFTKDQVTCRRCQRTYEFLRG